MGLSAGANNTSGSHNTYIGRYSCANNKTGSNNTALGMEAGKNCEAGSYNVFLGNLAGADETSSHRLHIGSSQNTTIFGHLDTRRIGIATTVLPEDTDYKLAVGGKVIAEEIKVSLIADWSDYVFEENFELISLIDLEAYILKHGHLPEVPNATEVTKNGLELGQMIALLLKKIEELTLYTLAQEKKITQLQDVNQILADLVQDVTALKEASTKD